MPLPRLRQYIQLGVALLGVAVFALMLAPVPEVVALVPVHVLVFVLVLVLVLAFVLVAVLITAV